MAANVKRNGGMLSTFIANRFLAYLQLSEHYWILDNNTQNDFSISRRRTVSYVPKSTPGLTSWHVCTNSTFPPQKTSTAGLYFPSPCFYGTAMKFFLLKSPLLWGTSSNLRCFEGRAQISAKRNFRGVRVALSCYQTALDLIDGELLPQTHWTCCPPWIVDPLWLDFTLD